MNLSMAPGFFKKALSGEFLINFPIARTTIGGELQTAVIERVVERLFQRNSDTQTFCFVPERQTTQQVEYMANEQSRQVGIAGKCEPRVSFRQMVHQQ